MRFTAVRMGINRAILSVLLISSVALSDVVDLKLSNFHDIVGSTQVVMVNFYANWCKFSRILTPVYEELGKTLSPEFPQPNKLVVGRVDCDAESELCGQLSINKYPTLKMWRYGQLAKREYRGQRSVEALSEHLRGQLTDPITAVDSLNKLNVDEAKKKPAVVAYYTDPTDRKLHTVARIATALRDDCHFFAAFGDVSAPKRTAGDNIVFREHNGDKEWKETPYVGPLDDVNLLGRWINDRCVPLVREITFENAEELTEEGLPFVIFFYNPDDRTIIDSYKQLVGTELYEERTGVNFLTADGVKFSHPLHHLGKGKEDLPLIAIDSFRHMFIFPDVKEMEVPGKMKQFIKDLHTGRLHRIFHYGYDPKDEEEKTTAAPVLSDGEHQDPPEHIPVQADADAPTKPPKPSSPPESTFAKLAPSSNRYTLLRRHDEL